MDKTIDVVVVTSSRSFFETGLSVLNDVRGDVFQNVTLYADIDYEVKLPSNLPIYEEAKAKAIRFLGKYKDSISLRIIQADSLDNAQRKILDLYRGNIDKDGRHFVGLTYLDYTDQPYEEYSTEDIDLQLKQFYSSLEHESIPVFCSASSTAVFRLPGNRKIYYQPSEYIDCILPDNRSILQTELLCLWMDFFEMSYMNRRIKPGVKLPPNNTIGEQLTKFLCKRSGTDWMGYYYTGSVVSSFIKYLENITETFGIYLLRGTNEHSLACGAMANWLLYNKPFLLAVTCGMIDEFKGTLANLVEARAKGFIICAECCTDQWFFFQGTITVDEDTREVLKARRVQFVYFDKVETIGTQLKKAFELYDTNQGPIVLLATRAVLEACSSIDIDFPVTSNSVSAEIPDLRTQIILKEVMEIINTGPDKVIWQCGPMNREELELTLSIAQRAGIALVDSLTHPGSVPKFYKGKLNRNYLGTLAAYGYNSRVYCYLHYNGKINPVSEQCLFFLKNKLTQVATPFSAGRLNRKLKIVQLTHNDRHISPFTNYPLVLNYRAFLQYVDKHLDISPKTRARRYQAMDAVVDTPSDVMSKLPKMPMSPNYFFARFNQVIERLIVQNDFDYTGVYDVGRCGLSAIRNVSRTRPGFSGWYGRALMGDALQAISSLAFTAHGNIIGFIGDGAKGVVPDVVPSLIENALSYQDMRKKNITIFFFLNGGHSVIRTYQERILFNRSSRQMRLINIFPQDWEEEICGIQIVSRVLDSFDASKLTSAMLKQGVINLFSVVVSHNNEGDGLSLATATGWQRDQDFASNHSSRKNVKSEQVIHEFQ